MFIFFPDTVRVLCLCLSVGRKFYSRISQRFPQITFEVLKDISSMAVSFQQHKGLVAHFLSCYFHGNGSMDLASSNIDIFICAMLGYILHVYKKIVKSKL